MRKPQSANQHTIIRSRALRTAASIASTVPSGSIRGCRRGGVPPANGLAGIEVTR
jgi:hypothetical protein